MSTQPSVIAEQPGVPRFLQSLAQNRDFLMMAMIIGVVALMIIPLPPLILDLLLTINITLSVIVLLTSIYVTRPLDFSVFPALLLITTLFRLGLNVASTRLILIGASEAQMTAGNIIQTFGNFVVGGNTVVGIIIFLILVLINFMVITKGAGRIAEVSARFTLDALPGKQMSIDAELAAGTISEKEARERRSDIERESDFYGAMDGASKFVRGDAIAGLIITAINILASLLIGVTQAGMPISEAFQSYTVLTVGDGLVSQIPALLISTGAGIIVTRAASATDFGGEVSEQLFNNYRVLFGAAAVLGLMSLIPGMPFLIFLALGGGIGWVAYKKMQAAQSPEEESDEEEETPAAPAEARLETLLEVENLTLEIGYSLVPLVDSKGSDNLLHRFIQMRRQFAEELGIIVPPIHIRDNLALSPGSYRLLLKGINLGGGDLQPNRLMAIDPGGILNPVEGSKTKDPSFGLDALWISPNLRFQAESAGYTVVELDGVITTHVSEMVRQNAFQLFGWQELQERLDAVKDTTPKLVDDVVPTLIPFSGLLQVLRRLLREHVSIRDMRTILEAVAEHSGNNKNITSLTNQVRSEMAPTISQRYSNEEGVIFASLLDRPLEERLRQCMVTQQGEPVLACDLATAQAMFAEIEAVLGTFALHDSEPLILAPPDLRAPLQAFLTQFFPQLHVICHREVTQRTQIVSVGLLKLKDGTPQQLSSAR